MIRPNRLLFLAPLLFTLPLRADSPTPATATAPAEPDTPTKIVDDIHEQFDNLLQLYATVFEVTSAKDAAPNISATATKIALIFRRMADFPMPPEDVLKNFGDVARDFAEKFKAVNDRIAKDDPKAADVLRNALSRIANAQPPGRWKAAMDPPKNP